MIQPENISSKLLFTCLLCFFLTHLCIAQVSKKTYQTIIASDIDVLRLNIEDATVELKETKGTRILVETAIKLSVPNDALLNFVIGNGRYELVQTKDVSKRELLLETKKDKNVIVVKGEICAESVVYTIYVPASMKAIK
ncbi:hypothetical protein [Aureispira sp. CCB-E]|uniref:hypothetical protein n=1 Tax=Aureispira sp. CCB-E TaxID=3051121 RepID=UPI0028694B89|nr:hypothetical protein [Aureispira sp. CCB-E]WMX16278.1 hypothetical protein QP953_07855 [Aureispira sp. CCB-E]